MSIHARAGPFTLALGVPITPSSVDFGTRRGNCFYPSSLSSGAGQFKRDARPTPDTLMGSLAHRPSCPLFVACSRQHEVTSMSRTPQTLACGICHFLATPPPFHTGTKRVASHFWSFHAGSTSPHNTPISGLRLIIAHASAAPDHSKMARRADL